LLFGEKKLRFETLEYLWTISPFSIRFCDFKQKSNSLSLHKDIEFHYVFDGTESYTLSEKECFLKKGDLICVNSYVPHNYCTLDSSKSVTLVVSLDFLIRNRFNHAGVLFEEKVDDPKVGEMLSEIIDAMQENDSAHDLLMNASVLKFVAYIAKNHSCVRTKNETHEGLKMLGSMYEYVCMAIDYISENFMNSISLDELSALCGLSKYHFLRIFKQVTNYTPTVYINRIRCNYAKQLLLNGTNVTEAATASGFSDIHYFSNCFKKYKGCRPSEIGKLNLAGNI
jgi:AraC-like DNA-binding protein